MIPSKSSPTIHDVARRLKVSATTVWRAINDQPRVSARTKDRVLRAVRRLGYQPSLLAQSLSQGRTQTLGVVVPTIGNPVYATLVRAVEHAAFERDYNIILCDTDFHMEREQRYLDLLLRRKVEGVLIIPTAQREEPDAAGILAVRQAGVPVVAMQQPLEGIPQVAPDNQGASRAMIAHLIGLGHRRIALVHGGLYPWHPSIIERFEGYKQALADAGIAFDADLVVQAGTFAAVLAEGSGAFDAAPVSALLRRHALPTAIFAPTDVLAIRVMAVIRSLGLRIPDDIAVVGFDDIAMAEYLDPPLTTVRHPATLVGRRATELLFEQLASGQLAPPTIERLPCELMIRQSCGHVAREVAL
jgi:DNA-binding LacI/PurR family transcriptional regulator